MRPMYNVIRCYIINGNDFRKIDSFFFFFLYFTKSNSIDLNVMIKCDVCVGCSSVYFMTFIYHWNYFNFNIIYTDKWCFIIRPITVTSWMVIETLLFDKKQNKKNLFDFIEWKYALECNKIVDRWNEMLSLSHFVHRKKLTFNFIPLINLIWFFFYFTLQTDTPSSLDFPNGFISEFTIFLFSFILYFDLIHWNLNMRSQMRKCTNTMCTYSTVQ